MKRIRWIVLLMICILSTGSICSQSRQDKNFNAPFFGAQVFIEPGQTQPLIESWFKTLRDNGMTYCRIRMFESYMLQSDGTWDFTLFDYAFHAADKYGIRVYATLFPATAKTDIGGWKFPENEEQKQSFSRYIQAIVSHYRTFPALHGWVLINEPGMNGVFPQSDFISQQRREWDRKNPPRDFKENGYPILMTTANRAFLKDLNTSFLNWIADEILKYDTAHDMHVNPAGIFLNYPEYDLPAWRKFLTSLGGSAHAAWHFSAFTRQQYALAMLATAEIIRSGAGDLPWFMTELQGGNNTYSGMQAMCPTPEEIEQWLWIILGCEGKGSIFWMLNPRSSGIESGEWAMIDFQGNPSERLKAVQKTAKAVKENKELLSHLKIISSGIDVVYLKEAAWAEELMTKSHDVYTGRQHGAAFKSAAACFKALTERGLNVGLKELQEYDFTQEDYTEKSIIISHQICFPSQYRERLETFVQKGGTLFIDGLTAFFDEDLHNTMNTGFTLQNLLGGNISEFILKENLFTLQHNEHQLPVHAWLGTIYTPDQSASAFVHENKYGKGKVIWFPSPVGLGAWVSKEYRPLSDFLISLLPLSPDAIMFEKHHGNMLMRTLKSGNETILICINKSTQPETIRLKNALISNKSKVVYKSSDASFDTKQITINPEGIIVIKL